MLFSLILASAHLVLVVVVVIRVAPFGTDGDRPTRIADVIGESRCVGSRLRFIEFGLSVCFFGTRMRLFSKFERCLGKLELSVLALLRGLGRDCLHIIPLLQNACFSLSDICVGLHETARGDRHLGLDSRHVKRTGRHFAQVGRVS